MSGGLLDPGPKGQTFFHKINTFMFTTYPNGSIIGKSCSGFFCIFFLPKFHQMDLQEVY